MTLPRPHKCQRTINLFHCWSFSPRIAIINVTKDSVKWFNISCGLMTILKTVIVPSDAV